jgi:hypothetical protein
MKEHLQWPLAVFLLSASLSTAVYSLIISASLSSASSSVVIMGGDTPWCKIMTQQLDGRGGEVAFTLKGRE